MNFIADLHIHGRYSRGCSTNIDIESLEKWARIKGLGVIGTGDFTHPEWLKHLKENLTEEEGILKTKTGFNFVLQTEISLIYTQDGKGRRIHNVVLAPSFEIVDIIRSMLLKRGRLDYDGRPIFKIPCPDFVEMMKNISNDIEVIPAHCMTPHFSLFGDYNKFSTVEDCFQDQTKHIHAIETGLSADPQMLSRMSQLDKYLLVSFSDCHSFWPWRIGREATIFDLRKLNYRNLINAIRTKDGFVSTVEFWPEEGKYHFSGHRACKVSLGPKESLKLNNICPKCGTGVTVGVAQRVEELADRPEDSKRKIQNSSHFIPLSELIAASIGKGVTTKAAWDEYNKLISKFDNEFNVLLSVPEEQLEGVTTKMISSLIIRNRQGKIKVKPGYDGIYGEIMFKDEPKQKGLGEFI
ncbi:MAG: endonuclease Q family protein [Candidatus Woesearchaeota archaeon]